MKLSIRLDLAAALVAFLFTGESEMARLWFAIWHVR